MFPSNFIFGSLEIKEGWLRGFYILRMKQRILNYRDIIKVVKRRLKDDLVDYFKTIDFGSKSDDLQIMEVRNEEDLNHIWSSQGFYLILTDQKVKGIENCTFEYSNYRVIYRGHSYHTKKRIMSHLANDSYNQAYNGKDVHYGVCLKLDSSGRNGINIDQEPFTSWGWVVIVFKMRNSDVLIREQAETAFDELFGRPCRSMEQ